MYIMKLGRLFMLTVGLALLTTATPAANNESGVERRHPSYNLIGRDASDPSSSLNLNFVVSEEVHLKESGFWRSSYLQENLVGLTVADIDGDGQNEVIYASEKNIYVTRFSGGQLIQLAQYSLPVSEKLLSVDVLDLNGDRRMEIIASGQDENHSPASLILKFSGNELTPLARKLPWYLRVLGPANSRFLAGQKASFDRTSVYSGNVMRLIFDGSSISSQGVVNLPEFVNLFNFTLGHLGASNLQITAAIKFPSEHIFLYEGQNRAWESREEYGGTMICLTPANYRDDGNRKCEFLPSRLLIADIDQDGQNELIVAKNDRGGVPFMSNQRGFTSGTIQAFKYSNMSLTPLFRTRTLPGAGVDYQLADFNNNGTLDLVVAVVTEQKSGLMKEGRSVIVAYEIGTSH